MRKKLTPWFPGDVKPVRAGVYEKDFGPPCDEYQYWDGKRWFYGEASIEGTILRKGGKNEPIPIMRAWRGLTKESK